MFTLKNYQKNALSCLDQFLINCRIYSYQHAFNKALLDQGRPSETYNQIFKRAPSVCLRVPTGGGKTIIAAHSVALAGKAMLDSDSPTVLWLTPSDTIRSQTIEALSDPKHPYRQALAEKFGDRVRVCDLETLQTINPKDIGQSCVIVVATIQAFNVTNTTQRNVYSFFEDLAPHFSALPSNLTAFEVDRKGCGEKTSYPVSRELEYRRSNQCGRRLHISIFHHYATWNHVTQADAFVCPCIRIRPRKRFS